MANLYTYEIAKAFHITLEAAEEVQARMYIKGFDFSESSAEDFRKEMKYAYDQWRHEKLKDFNPYIHGAS